MKRAIVAASLVLAACGGEAFSSLNVPPARGDAGAAGEGSTPVLEDDAGDVDAASSGQGDGSIRIDPAHDASPAADVEQLDAQPVRDASPAADVEQLDAGDVVDGDPACTTPSACPRCGSAIQVACCTASARCGCAYGGGLCVAP